MLSKRKSVIGSKGVATYATAFVLILRGSTEAVAWVSTTNTGCVGWETGRCCGGLDTWCLCGSFFPIEDRVYGLETGWNPCPLGTGTPMVNPFCTCTGVK